MDSFLQTTACWEFQLSSEPLLPEAPQSVSHKNIFSSLRESQLATDLGGVAQNQMLLQSSTENAAKLVELSV